jgi:hypothetical protein
MENYLYYFCPQFRGQKLRKLVFARTTPAQRAGNLPGSIFFLQSFPFIVGFFAFGQS